ncbi:Acid-sensing ion channel 2 [Nymphon striatum]|nr:Acid-sensing ion channel 2 [Nymphon striatum]
MSKTNDYSGCIQTYTNKVLVILEETMVEEKRVRRSCISNGLRVLAVAAMVFGLGYSVFSTVKEYINDNVVVTVKHENGQQEFPAVTICNKNPMQCPRLLKTPLTAKFLFNKSECPKFVVKNCSDTADRRDKADKDWEDMDETTRRKVFMIKSAKLSLNVRKMVGQKWKSMIRDCKFGGKSCMVHYTSDTFLETLNLQFGVCQTFGSAFRTLANGTVIKDENNVKTNSGVGPENGLMLIFRSAIPEYIPGISEESGMRIVIHSPHEAADIMLDGIDISPGKSTLIRVRNLRREGFTSNRGIGALISIDLLDMSVKNTKNGNLTYDLLYECQGHTPDIPKKAEFVWCCYLERATKHITFVIKVRIKVAILIYNPGSQDRVMDKYFTNTDKKELTALNSNKTSLQMFVSDFGKVTIYLNSRIVEEIKEVEKYTVFTLIGNFGGFAGLYIGISFLSIYDMLEGFFYKLKRKFFKTNAVIDDENSSPSNLFMAQPCPVKTEKVLADYKSFKY